jgi:phospholipid/cholesterol/gamma-HCH transport system permease protein
MAIVEGPSDQSAEPGKLLQSAENLGRETTRAIQSIGFGMSLLSQSLYWLFMGRRVGQPVRAAPIAAEMMQAGIGAIPIVAVLSGTIGLMLALQGIDVLEPFGAQDQVTIGVSLSIVREFGPLITGIIVAGRSGSALAARLGTMIINNEVDALQVMGVNPVRYLVVPSLVAMLVMLPCLALLANMVGLLGAGMYITNALNISFTVYLDEIIRFISVDDLLHGLSKSVIFGGLIAVVGVVNGSSVSGGAEGVGRVTTSSVVQSITAIVLADMLFVFAATR